MMRYNKYVATAFVTNRVVTAEPSRQLVNAAVSMFKDYPHIEHCYVRRCLVDQTGGILSDPHFKALTIPKKSVLDKMKRA